MDKVLSFVIPVKDEQDTLVELTIRIFENIEDNLDGYRGEIIFIDDGSIDNSWGIIEQISKQNPKNVKAFRFRKNLGKALALDAGFRACSGSIVFTLDADLQDDPKEIPKFIEKLHEGYDLVSGWKEQRHDPLSKTLPSRLFNLVTSRLTGVNLKDFNCGFKCYRREVIANIRLYGELHRYIPVLAADLGYRIGEVSVEHHPRQHGFSKYGWERYARGLIDLLTVMATTRWLNKPGHLFGSIGLILGLVGGLSLTYLFVVWLFGLGAIGTRPLLTFGVLTTIASLQMLSLGVIAEFFIKQRGPTNIEKYISQELSSSRNE